MLNSTLTSNTPLISVLIASYNHAHFIEETIRSIWSQPYGNIEIIVVDDASADSSAELLMELKNRSPIPMEVVVNAKNAGPSVTCNTAIRRARGELIAFIASDDLFTEDRFSHQLEIFARDPLVQIVYGNGLRFQEGSTSGAVHGKEVCELMSRTPEGILRFLYTNTNPLFMQTALLRRELLTRIGGYDESELADDWIINTRIFQDLVEHGGTFGYVDRPLFLYRIHGSNLHANFARHSKLKLDFISKYTPAELKAEAFANIGHGLALQAAQAGLPREALKYFFLSQRNVPDYRKYPKFVRRFAKGLLKRILP